MATLETVISADSHMLEPADLWTSRLPARFKDRAPQIYFDEARDTWLFGCPGIEPVSAAGFFGAGKSARELKEHQRAGMEQARAGGWDPAERLKDMVVDGIVADVLYTSLAFNLFWLEDAAFQEACFAAYNDWLAEFCSYAPDRFAGLGLVSCYNVDHAVAELHRIRKLGLRSAMIWCSPPEDRSFTGAFHDPFWAAAQDLDMPISLHILTGAGRESRGLAVTSRDNRYLQISTIFGEIMGSLSELIFGGVFERFPRLKIVSAENGIGWIPYFVWMMDSTWKRFRHIEPTPLTMLPSEYFKRNVWATFIADPVGLRIVDMIGLDRVMWSSDYPHTASTWPRSLKVIERQFADLPEEWTRKICRENAAGLYGFDLSRLTALPAATAAAD